MEKNGIYIEFLVYWYFYEYFTLRVFESIVLKQTDRLILKSVSWLLKKNNLVVYNRVCIVRNYICTSRLFILTKGPDVVYFIYGEVLDFIKLRPQILGNDVPRFGKKIGFCMARKKVERR